MSTETVEPLKITLKRRLEAEGRWTQVEPLRDQMMREARKGGMSKEAAQEWVYAELDRLYPPAQSVVIVDESDVQTTDPESGVQGDGEQGVSDPVIDGAEASPARPREGLGQLPADWPTLPDNAPLVAEIGWVQAQQLRIVEERPGGQNVIRLNRAGSPPPSWAALGWLNTAIRNPAKWADIAAKGLGQQELESDITKRERRSIEDVRTLLGEMHAQLG